MEFFSKKLFKLLCTIISTFFFSRFLKKIENQSDNSNVGIVKEVAYLGSYTKYLIEVNGIQFYSFMQNSLVSDNLQIKWDDKVEFKFNDSSIFLFND